MKILYLCFNCNALLNAGDTDCANCNSIGDNKSWIKAKLTDQEAERLNESIAGGGPYLFDEATE